MKIDERIEEMQSKLIRILTETNSKSTEEIMRELDGFGIDVETATKLIEAYQNAESAKKTAKNVWDDALNCRQGDDLTTHIAKSQQQEADTRQYFDTLTSQCALLIVVERLNPSKINDEILDKLYGEGIQEEQIYNPALKLAYHYYCENKEIYKGKSADLEKIKAFASNAKNYIEHQKKHIEELEKQNEKINKAYKNLQCRYSTRIVEDEKHYQEALSLIRELKGKISKLQSRGIFQVIGDKIFKRNEDKIRRLPRGVAEIPETLYQSKFEKAGMFEIDKDILTTTSEQTQPSSDKRTDKKDELQQ